MICPKCGTDYETLVCDVCVKRRAEAAYRKLQPFWLRLAQEGRIDLPLVTIEGWTHIELFAEHQHTFCGRTIEEQHHKRSIGYHYFDIEHNRCIDCEKAMRQFLET